MRRFAVLLLLAGCSAGSPADDTAGAGLEAAAIARGVVRDPASTTLTGLYAREGDRLCLIERDDGAARVGAFVDYGDGIGCSAGGSAVRDGGRLAVDFGQGCRFVAGFDGDRIAFPGALPPPCEGLCTRRASLAGLALDRLSESASEARALRDPKGVALCG